MTAPHQAARGFSLVELMVSVVIGMLALLFALRLFSTSEATRQATLGGSDSMQNGMVALFSISGDAGQAGFGLNDPLVAGCDTRFSDTGGYALAGAKQGTADVHPLAPLVIEASATGSDRVSFYAGTSSAGTAALGLGASYASGTKITVDNDTYGFAENDVIVVAPTVSGTCSLAQVTAIGTSAAGPVLDIGADTAHRFNSGALGVAYTKGLARVFNLGQADALPFHTWSVTNGYLQLRATGQGGAAAQAATVADNIVALKAQYGFDTRAGAAFQPAAGLVVGQWSATVVNADGLGATGDAGDYQRLAAVRLAVVARGKTVERVAPGATCTSTTAKPVVFASAGPGAVAAVPVTVEVAVPGDTVDWRCYRYRVFETTVTLRNASWRP